MDQSADETEDQIDSPQDPSVKTWRVFGRAVPRSQIVFLTQVVIVYIVIVACIVNLSTHNGSTELWTALLSSSLGYLLPAPQLEDVRVPPVQ